MWNAWEAAAYFHIHMGTVRRMARSGEIVTFTRGKDGRFHKEALPRSPEG